MAIDKLRYESQNVSIAREIQKYPKYLGIREGFQNAVEGDGTTGATDIQFISVNTVQSKVTSKHPKFAVWDNGPGMSANNLKKLTDMASSTKQMRGKTNPNFGRGEIAATLSYNSYGVFWISCYEGRVNLVWLRKLGEDYGRNQFKTACPINNSTVVQDITDSDLMDSLNEQYEDLFTTDRTWTAKIYLGNGKEQNTCESPFGDDKQASLNWAYNALYKRYHHIPGSNIEVTKDKKLKINNTNLTVTFNKGTFLDVGNKKARKRVFTTEAQDFIKTLNNKYFTCL